MKHNRRSFMNSVGAAAGIASIAPSSVFGETAPSKQITLGFIGTGSQGIDMNLRMFLREKDCRVLAVCDAYMSRAKKAAEVVNGHYKTEGCLVHQDFRKIIENPAVDAVVISTPDHWHVPMSIMALEAGKDVFCEKPTYCIAEGRVLADAFRKKEKIFQAGLEDRSLIHYHKMVEWVKNGAIGELERVEVTLPNGHDHPKEDPVAPPADLDWNMWLGPAPYHDYSPNRTEMWHWRNINDYAKGVIVDWGTHLVDTAQVGIDDPDICPVEVSGTGRIPEGRMSDTPNAFDLNYRYSNGVEMNVKNGGTLLKFIGSRGWVKRGKWGGGLEASDPSILRTRYRPDESKHRPRPPLEQRNFLDCVKSRGDTTYTAETMHKMSTTLHMGVMCIQLGRKLQWDPKKEEFVKDREANRQRERPEYRKWWEM